MVAVEKWHKTAKQRYFENQQKCQLYQLFWKINSPTLNAALWTKFGVAEKQIGESKLNAKVY